MTDLVEQWSLGEHILHLNGHPDAYYFTGEILSGYVQFCPNNDCNLKDVSLYLKGKVVFQVEGKVDAVALLSLLHPRLRFKDSVFLNETVRLFEGLIERDEIHVWSFSFTIPENLPPSTDDKVQPNVLYNLRIDYKTGKLSKLSYRHPLRVLTKVSPDSPLLPAVDNQNMEQEMKNNNGEVVFACSMRKNSFDSTEKIIMDYKTLAGIEKLEPIVAHFVRNTKICFSSTSKTIASVDLNVSNDKLGSDFVVVYKGDGLIFPTLLYEQPNSKLKISVNYEVRVSFGSTYWLKKLTFPVVLTNKIVSSIHKNFH